MSSTLAFQSLSSRVRDLISSALARPDQSSDHFETLALDLFRFQFAANEVYRSFCLGRKVTPESVESWLDIPAMPAAAFKDFAITTLPPAERQVVFHSSGTTEQRPGKHFHSPQSLEVYEASLWRWFSAHLLADQLPTAGNQALHFRLVALSPPPGEAPNSSLVHMFEIIRRRFNADENVFLARAEPNGWTLQMDALLAALHEDTRPLLLLGTAFSFVHLVDFMGEHKMSLALPPGSRLMETGGYKGRSRVISKPALHKLLTKRLGFPDSYIVSEYGMSELSSQAYDHAIPAPVGSKTRVFRFPPWARAEIISSETGVKVEEGEAGLLRMYDLANICSAIAVQTEDLAIRRADGFELIGRAETAEPRGCSLMNHAYGTA